jgi:hypothetical protein
MWRGRALEEFADQPFAQPSATRLEGMREAASQLRVEALLELGRLEPAVADLEGLILRYPLRERLRELYMLGLYRMGRQADALDAARSARRALSEELGVDPGPSLAAIEQAILRHDPELLAPARPQIATPADPEPAAASALPTPVRGGDAPHLETPGAGARAVAAREPASSRRTRRPLLVLAGAGSVLAVVAAAIVIPRSDDPSRSVQPASSSPSAVAAPGTGDRTWIEVPDADRRLFGGPGDQLILGGVASAQGVIAVGYSASPRVGPGSERDYDAALWTLGPDGWSRVDQRAFDLQGRQQATDAAVGSHRIVIVGSTTSPLGDLDAAIWTRTLGGTKWVLLDRAAPGVNVAGTQVIRDVVWTGTGFVAVGKSIEHGEDDAATWTSTTGLSWSRIVPTSLGIEGDQEMVSVAASPDAVVAGGFSTGADRDAAVWILASDGWEPIVDDEEFGGDGDQQINAIAAAGPGLVAVGQEIVDGEEDAVVWVSDDGRDWERIDAPAGTFDGPGIQKMSTIAVSGNEIVAAGEDLTDELDAAVWTSPDGRAWTRVPSSAPGMSSLIDYGGQDIRALISFAGGLVAAGRETHGGHRDDADVWIGTVEP